MGFELRNDTKAFKMAFDENDFSRHGFKEDAIKIKIPFGQLAAKQWLFDDIKILYSEIDLDKPIELDWKGDTELVTMHFNLQGSTSIMHDGMSHSFELHRNQHNLFYGTNAEGKMKLDELHMKSFMVQCV